MYYVRRRQVRMIQFLLCCRQQCWSKKITTCLSDNHATFSIQILDMTIIFMFCFLLWNNKCFPAIDFVNMFVCVLHSHCPPSQVNWLFVRIETYLDLVTNWPPRPQLPYLCWEFQLSKKQWQKTYLNLGLLKGRNKKLGRISHRLTITLALQ